jgi:hypothetical protein
MSSRRHGPPLHKPTRPARRAGLTLLATTLIAGFALPAVSALPASAAVPGTAPGTVNEPPTNGHSIIAFPQRDFVSASGFADGHTYTVDVVHPDGTVRTAGSGLVPLDDPSTPTFDGLIEVNHPGGYCWAGTTPDIRPGDKVRVIDDAGGATDQTTVANVTAQRPVQTAPDTVVIHGTATANDGTSQIPVAEIEQRLVANRQAFDATGARTLRAASVPPAKGGGTLAYDSATGNAWTATYTGLTPHDVDMALGSESRILWLGKAVAPAVESTIYENGAGIVAGPAGPQCTAPLEKLPPPPGSELVPPTDPTGVTGTVTNGNTVTLNWTASTDNVGVVDYGIYRDGIAIATVQNADGVSAPPTTFVDKNVPPGTYVYSVDAGDAVGNRSGQAAAPSVTTVRPVADLPAGTAVHEPPVAPIQIISFPARDFVSSSGFQASDTVDVQILRKEAGALVLVSSTTWTPQDDPKATPGAPFAGIVEVNHPGGACWDGTTPDMRAGDIVREIAYNPDGSIRTVEQTTTSNVVAKRPVITKHASNGTTARDGEVQITGVAMDANGNPIPAAQVEQRLVANRDAFDLNGRRTLRAGGAGKDGAFSYDATNNPTGVNWTAIYSGLSEDDVVRAAGGTNPATGHTFTGAESRVLWLSATPAAAPEITIYENDGAVNVANGPAGPACTAPGEPLDTKAPTFATTSAGLTAVSQPGATAGTNDVKLTWTAASDDVAVYGYRVYRDGQPLRNVGADTLTYLDQDVVGSHTYTVDATDAASPGVGGNAQGTPYGNRSAQSDPVTVASADNKAPTVPANLVATVSPSGSDVTLNWSASTDNVKVTGYGVYRRTAATATAPAGAYTKLGTGDVTATTYTDAGLATGKYEYAVDATDAAGNRSAKTDPPATANAVGDTVAPSDVTGLKAGNDPDIHGTSVLVQWAAATDNVGVTGYGVYRDGVKIADVNAPSLSYLDTNRPAGTYKYTVDAVDSAGNRSLNKPAEVSVVVANDPPKAPHDVIGFPARDFISATGYVAGRAYNFSLFHPDGKQYASVNANASTDGTGTVEVNHPGGACWIGTTPNMKPGDVIRITDTVTNVAEQTTVANVTAERPSVESVDAVTGGGVVVVHGTAKDSAGKQIPVASLENRLIANKDAFDLNGRRTVRAGGAGTDGTLTYDSATSTNWTAKYTFQTPNDLARAVGGTSTSGTAFVGAESRAIWLGRDPAALNEQTIFENGAGVVGGPAGLPGCTDVAETPAPGAALSAAPAFTDTTVGSTSAAQTVTLTNNGTAPLTVTKAYLAGLNPGDYVKGIDNATGATVAPGASVTVQVSFKPTAAGTRQAYLAFADDAANTTDQAVVLNAKTPVSATQTATAPVNSLAAGAVIGQRSPVSDSVLPVDLRWTGSGPAYQLQMATGATTTSLGAFTDVPLANAGATSTTVNLRMGTTTGVAYKFQVRACTTAATPVCGAWAVGAAFTLLPVDDANIPASSYKGTWTALTGTAAAGNYNSTTHWAAGSANVGQTVSFTVTGNAAWVGRRGPDEGQAQVQVDGGTPQVVDLYSPTEVLGTVVWARDGLAAGNHTVTITVLGKKSTLNTAACNTGTKCARVDVDLTTFIK